MVTISAPRATSANPGSTVNPGLDDETGRVRRLPPFSMPLLHRTLLSGKGFRNGLSLPRRACRPFGRLSPP